MADPKPNPCRTAACHDMRPRPQPIVETEDFRPADPREHAEYYQVGDGVYICAAPGGSPPPSAAADVNALALQAAHSATAATHDLVGLATEGGPFAGYVSHQIVLHLADALGAAITLHRHAEDEGDPVDARLLHLAELLTNFLENQNG